MARLTWRDFHGYEVSRTGYYVKSYGQDIDMKSYRQDVEMKSHEQEIDMNSYKQDTDMEPYGHDIYEVLHGCEVLWSKDRTLI